MLPKRIIEKFSSRARHCLQEAGNIARVAGEKTVRPKHLILAITLEEGGFGQLFFKNAGIDRELISKHCFRESASENAPGNSATPNNHDNRRRKKCPPLSSDTKAILAQAFFIASDFHSPYVGTEHLAYSVLENPGTELDAIIASSGIDREKTIDALESHLEPDHFTNFGRLLDLPNFSLARPDEGTKDETPALSQFTIDLATESRKRGEAFFGRDTEMERIVRILGRKEKNNPLLLGDPGVGKTAIVSALARRIERGDTPASLLGKRILALDLAQVVAGTSFRGEFETRLKDIVAEAKEHPEIILFIDELHTIIGAGNTQGGLDAANILKPALARGEIRVIGATTGTEYKRHIEKDPALSRRFQILSVREPTPEETRTLLRHIKPSYERFHGVSIPVALLDLAVTQSVRHMHDRFLPDKAIDILDEASSLAASRRRTDHAGRAAAAIESALHNLAEEKTNLIRDSRLDEAAALLDEEEQLRREQEELKQRSTESGSVAPIPLTAHDILETVSSMTGIPFSSLEDESPARRAEHIGKRLRQAVAHQEEAVSAIESSLTRALASIRDPEKPIGSFLFLGPSGVGKTHLAKTLARDFFGGEDRLIRLDMSEFMERHNVATMIGAPAGYVGFGEGGKLTERIRRTPHAVVLFDEIEKAHPDVWNVLLQILDEGSLTDAEGTRVSFRNAVIILTSNIGTESFLRGGQIGFSGESGYGSVMETAKRAVLEEARKTFRPELLARLEHAIVFNPLGSKALEAVTRLELTALRKRFRKEHISLSASAPVIRFLASKSHSPEHGARLVRKNIEELVCLPLSQELLKRGFDPENVDTTIRVKLSVTDDRIECTIV